MKILKISLGVVALLLVVAIIAAPIGPVPGFFIGGTPTEPPATWPDTDDVHEIRLRVPGTLPRVVIIWVIDYQGELHVVGARSSGWVSMLDNGGPVEMRLGDATYALTATPVREGWQPVLEAYVDKYRADYPDIIAGFPPISEAQDQVAVFRLDRQNSPPAERTETSSSLAPIPQVELRDDQDIGIIARFHFATHTPDFDRARAFYRHLGYTEGMGGFPLTNTHQMARALGMFDLCQYELAKGEVITLPGSINGANIDLLQFKTPFNGDPPYRLPNHLGMAYAALLTTDLASDVEYLESLGVEFLAEPFGIPGDRFVFFRDPDGVLYKLMETAPPHGDPNAAMHIIGMPYIGINVSDFEASLQFYRSLGYTQIKHLPETGSREEARAYGLDGPFRIKGADIAIDRGDQHVLRLVEWIEPFDPEPPYPPPINHIGINRIALVVPDLDRAVAIMQAQGIEFLSEIAPCCSGTGEDDSGIVHAIDPDGIFLEFVGPIARREPQPQPEGCPPLEIKMPPAT